MHTSMHTHNIIHKPPLHNVIAKKMLSSYSLNTRKHCALSAEDDIIVVAGCITIVSGKATLKW